MRMSFLWVLLAGLGLSARAATVSQQTISWSVLPQVPAAEDALALGPDLLAAGPDGALALWNAADGALWLVQPGRAPSAHMLGHVDDLAWTEAGILLLDESSRRLVLVDTEGQTLATRPLPDLSPVGMNLVVSGARVDGADPFGNRHPLARLDGQALVAATGPALLPPAVSVRWDAAGKRMWVEGRAFSVPGAIKAGGRVLGDAAQGWLVVDAVVSEGPLVVTRKAIPLAGGASVDLPVAGRLYAPSRDLAIDAEGRLHVLVPTAGGVVLWEVTP